MSSEQENSSPPRQTTKIPGPHIARTFDIGEALLLRAKQISQDLEERVRRLLQDEQHGPRGSHR